MKEGQRGFFWVDDLVDMWTARYMAEMGWNRKSHFYYCDGVLYENEDPECTEGWNNKRLPYGEFSAPTNNEYKLFKP